MTTLRSLSLIALALLTTGSCGPETALAPLEHRYVIIRADSLPGGSYLRFKPRLDGIRAEQMDVQLGADQAEVRFKLPATGGTIFTLDAVAVAGDGWPAAEGHVEVELPADHQTVTSTLRMVRVDQDVCVPTTSKADRWCKIQVPQSSLRSIQGTDSDNIWAAGSVWSKEDRDYVGSIWHWNGFRWRQARTPKGQKTQINAIWASAYGDAWAAGANGVGGAVLWRWNAREQAWEIASNPQNQFGGTPPLIAMWGASANDIWAAGEATGPSQDVLPIWHWDGTSWSKQSINDASSIRDIWGADSSHVWMVGDKDTILQWDGTGWQRPAAIPPNGSVRWSSVWASPAHDVWISDSANHLGRLIQGSWKVETSAQSNQPTRLRGACAASDNCELWGISGEQILHLASDGWVEVDKDRAEDTLYGLWALGPSSIWAAGERGRIWEVAPRDGVKRRFDRHSPPPDYLYDLVLDDQQRLWVFGERALRWDGWHWEQVGRSPYSAEKSDRLNVVYNGSGEIWAAPTLRETNPILHWNGQAWQDTRPLPANFRLVMSSRMDGSGNSLIATGIYSDGLNRPAFVIHDGTSWSQPVFNKDDSYDNQKGLWSCAADGGPKCIWMTNVVRDELYLFEDTGMPVWKKYPLVSGMTGTSFRAIDIGGDPRSRSSKMWILASSAGPSSALIAFEKSAGMSSWQSSIVEPSLPGALARLVVKAANEVWLIGASGFVRRSSGGDPRAESVDLSFDLRALPQLPEAMLSPPGLRAIAVGDRSLRQVWVCDDQNGGLWRLAQP